MLIPLLFMGDVVGRLFREFAITLAVTIVISAVVSLTLVPTLSARWLKRPSTEAKDSRLRSDVRPGDRSTTSSPATTAALIWVLDHQWRPCWSPSPPWS